MKDSVSGFTFYSPRFEMKPSIETTPQVGSMKVYLVSDPLTEDTLPTAMANLKIEFSDEIHLTNHISEYIRKQMGIKRVERIELSDITQGNIDKKIEEHARGILTTAKRSIPGGNEKYFGFYVNTYSERNKEEEPIKNKQYEVKSEVVGPIIGLNKVERHLTGVTEAEKVRSNHGGEAQNSILLILPKSSKETVEV